MWNPSHRPPGVSVEDALFVELNRPNLEAWAWAFQDFGRRRPEDVAESLVLDALCRLRSLDSAEESIR